MAIVFAGHKDYKDSDYVSCWFLKGADYIYKSNSKLAFVATNSISQGEQVGYLWSRIINRLEIEFAHQSFKWTNSAKGNAGVTCVIIGIRNINCKPKIIFYNNSSRIVKNISPYLHAGNDTIVYGAGSTLCDVPKMVMGSMARDGGNLILSSIEAAKLKEDFPESSILIKKFVGANEFLKSTIRWCLWISDENLEKALEIPPINDRINRTLQFRLASKAKTTRQYGTIPHKLAQRSHMPGNSIILPRVSSERREYIPFGFLDNETIISDSAQAIYGTDYSIFAFISSRMHMIWVKAIAGRLETRIRYSASLCYNTFPFPKVSQSQKNILEDYVFSILDQRENYSERTIAQLYDPTKMPDALRNAHLELDMAVEQCYRPRPFKNDEERLEYLFELYRQMTQSEN